MGFAFPEMQHMFGLPQRKDAFRLNTTSDNGPYRLFNQDLFPHKPGTPVNLYASIPYLTGHSAQADSSVAWMNSADTWVDIYNLTNITDGNADGTYSFFLSESGALEFFIFSSTTSPLDVQRALADITGYPPLPPAFSLGFHYSKWEDTSSKLMIERNKEFTAKEFQVDVFWLDIGHTLDKMYFHFNEKKFPPDGIQKMNAEIER